MNNNFDKLRMVMSQSGEIIPPQRDKLGRNLGHIAMENDASSDMLQCLSYEDVEDDLFHFKPQQYKDELEKGGQEK